MTDLARITSRLSVAGFSGLISELSAGPLLEHREYAFRALAPAKAVMALLYKWMTFRPDVKARTTLRLDVNTAILTVIPKGISEKRGRKPNTY
jgi:hypothetical protein